MVRRKGERSPVKDLCAAQLVLLQRLSPQQAFAYPLLLCAHGTGGAALAYFLVELPWLAWICLTVVPIVYFMVGFEPTAGAFFFYLLTVWVLTILMTSLGQLAAACIATVEVAQGVLSVFIPLLFVFGGLFLPGPSIPIGWRWAHYIDPIKVSTVRLALSVVTSFAF